MTTGPGRTTHDDATPHDGGPGPASATATVLIVDDEADNADALRFLLQLEGFHALTAGDGPAALDIASNHRPEVVLCDLGLPEPMDGFEVARRLRALLGDAVHLCAYSGYGSPADIEHARAAGFDAHITKPGAPPATQADIADSVCFRITVEVRK